jgi:methylated-DNA-[protein]-cysteine S-methyltransferase
MAQSTASYTLESPWGPIALEARGVRLRRVRLGEVMPDRADEILARAAEALELYFQDGETPLADLPLDLDGCSEFDRAVYGELATVPSGKVLTYGQVAERIGRPGAARAVGGALGRNPLPIVLPCHRVIRSDGSLGGFGAGPDWKRHLLEHEGRTIKGQEVCRHG